MNIFMRFPEGKAKALTLSYDDGVIHDKRLIGILDEYGIKATFNLNSGMFASEDNANKWRLTERQVKETYSETAHEVAVHATTHPFLEKLPLPLAIDEVLTDRKNLEKLFGCVIRGMAYPFGTYSDELIAGLKSIGIAYSRTTISTEDFRLPSDWLKLTATCHHKNPNLLPLLEKFKNASPEKEVTRRSSLLFYLWGHAYEFDTDNNWNVIEEFAKQAGNKADIWYATNIEIYNYIEAYKSLSFSVSGDYVYNPSCFTVWFEKDCNLFCVAPGETKKL